MALYSRAVQGNVLACIYWLKNRRPDLWRDPRYKGRSVTPVEFRDAEPVAGDGEGLMHGKMRGTRKRNKKDSSSAQTRRFAPICESCVSNGTLAWISTEQKGLNRVWFASESAESLAARNSYTDWCADRSKRRSHIAYRPRGVISEAGLVTRQERRVRGAFSTVVLLPTRSRHNTVSPNVASPEGAYQRTLLPNKSAGNPESDESLTPLRR
jgi:hypothetical protein